jgi:Zn-dependent protease
MKTALRLLTALVLVSGISMTIGNGFTFSQAQLSGGGANILHSAASTQAQVLTEAVLPAYQHADAATQMVIGILLILLGFFMHGLMISHEERNVHITVVPRKKRANRTQRWFWMEMRV